MRYVWADNSRISVPADVLREVVEEIRAEYGGLCPPQALVDAARSDDRVHDLFEWDDAVAAEHYRTQQARKIIGRLQVVHERGRTKYTRPAYVSVTIHEDDADFSGYMDYGEVRRIPDLHQQVLHVVSAQLQGLRRRHRAIKELKPVWEAVDQVTETVEEAPRRQRRGA